MRIDFEFGQSNHSFNAKFGSFATIHDGQNGATFIPYVSEDGVLSWTNDRELDNPTPVKIKGTDGKDGVDGKTPYIQDGYWYIDGENTGVKAEGKGDSYARIGEVTLTSSKWNGSDYLYSQIVSIEGVTKNTQVDLTPSVQQLAIFYEKDLAFVTENEDGVVTVYCIGQKPQNDYTIQVTMTEVSV